MWITSSRLYTLWSKSNNSNWMLHTGSNILQRPTNGQIKLDSIVSDSIRYGELMRGIYLVTIITYGDNLCLVEWSMICKKCLHLIQVYIGCPPPLPYINEWIDSTSEIIHTNKTALKGFVDVVSWYVSGSVVWTTNTICTLYLYAYF